MSRVIGTDFIGQVGFKSWVTNNPTPPQAIILVGSKGGGKTLASKYLAQQLNMDWYDVVAVEDGDKIKVDGVRHVKENCNSLDKPRLYHFENAGQMTNQAQNALLKVLEEPPRNAYFLLAVENENNLLNTIISRSRLLRLEPQTKQDILNAGYSKEVAEVSENIGQAHLMTHANTETLYNITKTVVTSIGHASLANVFKIPTKIKEEEYPLFLSILQYQFDNEMKENFQPWQTKAVNHISEFKRLFYTTTLNKPKLIEMLCVNLWREHRNELE